MSEAYERLGLYHPVEFARGVSLDSSARMAGTTTHMLVELYLDLERALRSVGLSDEHKVKFLLVCLDRSQAHRLRDLLRDIHQCLGLDVDLRQVTYFPHEASDVLLRGSRYYSWGVFCDHSVKEREGRLRNVGPYGLVRTIAFLRRDRYEALDRDGRRVCVLTYEGKEGLLDNATCPVTFKGAERTSPTTFGAWERPSVGACFRLTEAYNL